MKKKIYLISYDINTAVKNYDDLYTEIKLLAGVGEYQHPMESVWLVYSDLNADQIANRLRIKMDSKDRLFVTDLGTNNQGWLAKSVWTWIENHRKVTDNI